MMPHPLQSVLTRLESTLETEVTEYSGRNMFGRKCVAIELNEYKGLATLMAEILRAVKEDEREDVADAMEDLTIDNLGRGSIAYWPSISFVEE